ncbi:hypothetical protein [Streptomyces oryzae]|uniref:hypothetical protein n=1 Tax=Streptomyces oryzae TaxID=1434886 RepID=UPI001FFE1123|nr:hypothetical protein [Streptomyces oryzae]
MSVPSALERELAEALLELADADAGGEAEGHAGRDAAAGQDPKLTALAAHACRRLAREGRSSEAAAQFGAPVGSGPAAYGASGARAARLRLVEDEQREGPATDTLRSGLALAGPPLDGDALLRWPRYAPVALEEGVRAVHTVPLPGGQRTQGDTPGAGVLVVHLLTRGRWVRPPPER